MRQVGERRELVEEKCMPSPERTEILVDLAQRLKERRRALHKTAQDVASGAGITQTYLSMLENPKPGKSPRPSVDVLARLASALDWTGEELTDLLVLACHEAILPVNGVANNPQNGHKVPSGSNDAAASAHIHHIQAAPIPFDQWMLTLADPLIGREEELDWLVQRLREKPGVVAALHGMAGVGKTALAAAAVHRLAGDGVFPDGIAVVLCQGLQHPNDVLRRIIERFGGLGQNGDQVNDPPSHLYRLLREKRALMVLDDLDASLPVKLAISAIRAAGLTLLTTSREVLSRDLVPLDASRSVPLLGPDEALALFVRCLGYAEPTDLRESEMAEAQQIVASLDCHTLAVKLAGIYAADVRRDLTALATELADGSTALDLPAEEPQRLATLLSRSIASLDQPTQWLFQACSLFEPDIGRRAAAHVAQRLGANEQALDVLVRRALLSPSTDESLPRSADRERLHLHKLLSALAQRELDDERGVRVDHVWRAAAEYYAEYLDRVWSMPESERRHAVIEADEANIIHAVTWACTALEHKLVVQLCLGMRFYWRDRWLTDRSLRFLPLGVQSAHWICEEAGRREDHRALARLQLSYAHVLRRTGQLDRACGVLDEVLSLARNLNFTDCEAATLYELGLVSRQQGALTNAEAYFHECLTFRESLADLRGQGAALGYLARIALQRGEVDKAKDFCERSLAIAKDTQDALGEATVRFRLGQIALTRAKLDEASRQFTASLERYQALKDAEGEAASRSQLGRVALERSRVCADAQERKRLLDEAVQHTQRAQDQERALGSMWGHVVNLTQLGRIAVERGELDAAERLIGDAQRQAQETQDRWHLAVTQALLGRVALERAQRCSVDLERQRLLEQAEACYRDAAEHAETIPNPRGRAVNLVQLGRVAYARGNLDEAEMLFRTGINILDELNDILNFVDSALAFGDFLLATNRAQYADRATFIKVTQCSREMASDREQEAKAIVRRLSDEFAAQGDVSPERSPVTSGRSERR